MKVFLAGATGAIGTRLVPLLVRAGHTVTGATRHRDKAESIRAAGAFPAVVDALNPRAVLEAVQRAEPDVIIHQLTAIPARFNMRHFDQAFALTNRLRSAGTDHLLVAARAVGCRRVIAQSYAGWPYARTGGWVKTEEDPLMSSPEPAWRQSLRAILHVESAVLEERTMEGFVLRYGAFYGPGTSLDWSFIHIDDAAAATLAAVEANVPGLYNVTDDEPAPVSAWLPFLAEVLGAKAPRRIPPWLGRMAIGPHGVALMTEGRGASNQKAKSLLRWKLTWPSWRRGFQHGLGEDHA